MKFMVLNGGFDYCPIKDEKNQIREFNDLDKAIDWGEHNVDSPVIVNILHTSTDAYVRNALKEIIDQILERDEEMEQETLIHCVNLFQKMEGKIYLSLNCRQNCRIMATGRNSENRKELKNALLSYVSVDHDDEEMKKLEAMELDDLCEMFEFKILVHTDKFKTPEEDYESYHKDRN